jgi:hypothetical protein
MSYGARVQEHAAIGPVGISYQSNNTLGNTLICVVFGSGAGTLTVTDTLGNNWLPVNIVSLGSDPISIFYVQSCKAGANTVTQKLNGTAGTGIWVIAEYQGPSVLDVFNQAVVTSPASTAVASGSVVTRNANELCIGGFLFNSFTPSGGFSTYTESNSDVYLCDRLVATSGTTVNFTGTQGSAISYWAQVACFYQMPSGVPNSLMMMGSGT